MGTQKIDGVGIFLVKHGCQNVTHFHGILAGRLFLPHGALEHTTHAKGLDDLGLGSFGQRFHVFHEKPTELVAQPFHLSTARLQNLLALLLDGDGVQEMFERQELMFPPLHLIDGRGERTFQFLTEHRHMSFTFHAALERKTGTFCQPMYQVDLGLRHFGRIDAADTISLIVHG